MASYTATVMRVDDDHGTRAVVVQADDTIWISDELMAEARRPERPRITGDIEADGDMVTFGTPGEGLGRLTYRIVGRNEVAACHIATRTL